MRRKSSKFPRLTTIAVFAAILGLGGLLSSLSPGGFFDPITASADTSQGQSQVIKPHLFFRTKFKDFFGIGVNDGANGPVLQKQQANVPRVSNPCTNYPSSLNTGNPYEYELGWKGSALHGAADSFGNIYVVGKAELPPQVYFSRVVVDANGNCVPGSSTESVRLASLLGFSKSADPDITYSPKDKRVYMALEGPGSNVYVYSAPTVDGNGNPLNTNWSSTANWTPENNGQPVGNGGQPTPRIKATPDGRIHVVYRSGDVNIISVFKNTNGVWQNAGVISNSGGAYIHYALLDAAKDSTVYASWDVPGDNGVLTVGLSWFNPATATWSVIGRNVISNGNLNYSRMNAFAMAVGRDGTVYIGVGGNKYCAILLQSNPGTRGSNISFRQLPDYCYSSSDVSNISLSQGDNRLAVFTQDSARLTHYHEVAGTGGIDVGPVVSSVNPLPPSITIPTGQTSTTFPVSWKWVSGGTNDNGTGVTINLQYSTDGGASWLNFGTDQTITLTPTGTNAADVKVDMTAKNYPFNLKFRSIGTDLNPQYNEDPNAKTTGFVQVSLIYPAIRANLQGLPPTNTTNVVNVNWSGSGGKIVNLVYTIEVKDDNGNFATCLTGTTATSLNYPSDCTNPSSFKAISGHTYTFRLSATDNASVSVTSPTQVSTHIVLPISGFTASVPSAVSGTSASLTLSGQDGDVNPGGLYSLLSGLKFNIQYMDLTAGDTGWKAFPAVQGTANGTGFTNVTNAPFNAGTGLVDGHTYKIQVSATDNKTTSLPIELTTTVLTGQPVGTVYNNCYVVRLNVVRSLPVANTYIFDLTNNPDPNGNTNEKFKTINTSNDGVSPTSVLWNLADTQYDGPGTGTTNGNLPVWIRYQGDANWTQINKPGGAPFGASCTLKSSSTPLGDTNGSNRDFMSFYNPGTTDAAVFLSYYNGSALVGTADRAYVVKANGHLTVETTGMSNAHGIQVKSDSPVVSEQHTYNNNGNSGLDGMALNSASETTWYFTDSMFDGRTISYDVFNPGPGNVDVTLEFYDFTGTPVDSVPVNNIPPGRRTIYSGTSSPQSRGGIVGAKLTASGNVVAAQTHANGTKYDTSLGHPGTKSATSWYYPFIDVTTGNQAYITLWNPQSADITATFNFYDPNGGPMIKVSRTLGAKRISTYSLRSLLGSAPGLNTTNFQKGMLSVVGSQQVYAELIGAGNSGMSALRGTGLSNSWKIADVSDNVNLTGVGAATETLYLANFSSSTATVTILAYDNNGQQLCNNASQCTLTIGGFQRATVPVASLSGVSGKSVSIVVQSTGGSLSVGHSRSLGGDNFFVEAQP